MSHLEGSQAGRVCSYSEGSAFLFYSDLQLIRWGPPTLGRGVFFIQSMN